MLEGRAILITPSVLTWLKFGHNGCRVAGIYGKSCNLLNGKGDYLTLAFAEIGPGPFTILIELDESDVEDFRILVDSDTPVTISSDHIKVGNLLVSVEDAQLWNPEPNWDIGEAIMDEAWSTYLQQYLVKNGPTSSLVSVILRQEMTIYNKIALEGWLVLGDGLKDHNLDQILNGAHKLAGLGIGLTPAGDDFLLGVIYAIWTSQPSRLAEKMSLSIYRTAAPQTTSLSAYWLKVAARGQATKPWHDLLRAIRNVDDLKISEAANFLTSYGQTSGYDALAGYVLASKKLLAAGSPIQLT